MKKTLLFVLLALLLPLVADAYDFYVDGIYYDINPDGTSVTVTNKTGSGTTSEYMSIANLNLSSNISINSYGSQSVADESTWYSWTWNNVNFKGVRICKATDANGGGIQIQGNASDAAKQGFIFNNSAWPTDINKITIVLKVKVAQTMYDPAYTLYVGQEAHPTTTAITPASQSEEADGFKVYTQVFDLANASAKYFTIANNLAGALYIDKIYVEPTPSIKEFNPDGVSVSVTNNGSSDSYSGYVVIPSTVQYYGKLYDVTGIGSSAFSGCSALTSITVPKSVANIASNAFSGCTGLTSVTLNANDIVSKTYTSSSNLGTIFGSQVKEYILGDDVTSIGDYAFNFCSNLLSVTIPESVTSIGRGAFYNCSRLTSVTIPNGVTSIEEKAFYGCSGLTSVTIPSSVTSIGGSAFRGCSGLTSVVIGNSVTSIGSSAFSGCSSLTSVTIPNSVTSIGSSAFWGCSGLTSVSIGNSVTSIGDSAFRGCSGLKSVTVGNSVTSIGEYSFYGCSSLTSVTIPNSVTSIGSSAFNGCSSLTSITIPNSVTSIGTNAFPSDTKIYVDKGVSALIAVWNYGSCPYDLSTDDLLQIPTISKTNNCASSLQLLSSSSSNGVQFTNESFTVNGITKAGHTVSFTGLTPDTSYPVTYNATVKYGGNTFTYTKNYNMTTSALVLTTSQPKVISVGNAVVEAASNLDDAEENVGFEWRRIDWTEEFISNTTAAYLYEGTMEGYIRNLYTEKLWKVRPYYKDNNGKSYYGEWVGLDPTNTSYYEPTVHTYAKIDKTEDKVRISGYVQRGTDAVSKQGFKYWVQEDNARGAGISVPSSAKTVEAEGRVMEVELTGLLPNTTYSYVAFVTTTEGETFYGKQLSFTTGEDPDATLVGDANGNGVVEIGDVTSVLTLMATPEATGYDTKAADANKNGVIEIGDVTTILTIMAGGE